MIIGKKRPLKEKNYSLELSDVPDAKYQFVGDYSKDNSNSKSDSDEDNNDNALDDNIGTVLHELDIVDMVSPW